MVLSAFSGAPLTAHILHSLFFFVCLRSLFISTNRPSAPHVSRPLRSGPRRITATPQDIRHKPPPSSAWHGTARGRAHQQGPRQGNTFPFSKAAPAMSADGSAEGETLGHRPWHSSEKGKQSLTPRGHCCKNFQFFTPPWVEQMLART